MKRQSKIHYAWWILVALSIIVGIGKGAVNNSAGLFLPGVTKDLNIGMGTLTLYFSVSAIVTMVFLPIGGKLMAKYDTRSIIVVGIVLQAGAFALFGLMSSVWGWYILAIPLAMGGVFITVIVGPVVINQWFKTRNGLALGILSVAGVEQWREGAPELYEQMIQGIPLRRLGDPEGDIGRTAVFLASDDANYITGAEIVIDGGFSAQ